MGMHYEFGMATCGLRGMHSRLITELAMERNEYDVGVVHLLAMNVESIPNTKVRQQQ